MSLTGDDDDGGCEDDDDDDDVEMNVPGVSELSYVSCVNHFVPWLCSPHASKCPSSRGGAIVLDR